MNTDFENHSALLKNKLMTLGFYPKGLYLLFPRSNYGCHYSYGYEVRVVWFDNRPVNGRWADLEEVLDSTDPLDRELQEVILFNLDIFR